MTGLEVYVAIDVAGGKVVRLLRGDPEHTTVYRDDPVETAAGWEAQGAEWLHVVDLDGAIAGRPQDSIGKILEAVTIPVQVSGGVRSVEAIDGWLTKGAARVVIGTKALDGKFLSRALAEFGPRIVAAVDAKGGLLRVSGWQEEIEERAVDVAKRLADTGVARLMFTDIDRDGTLSGPNFEAIEELLDVVDVPVIAGGGVATEADVARLTSLATRGLEGIIIGKALYSGSLALEAAKSAALQQAQGG